MKKLVLNVCTGLLAVGYTIVFVAYVTASCANQRSITPLNVAFTWLFNLSGFAFFVTGILMAYYLRKYYNDFWAENWAFIVAATFLLSFPLFVRGVNLYLMDKKGSYYHYYLNHFAPVNTFYVVFSSILPITTQLASLIFGARHQ